MTTSSRMLIERMLHNSASVMLRQREDQDIPDYPLFTHEEIDRISRRLTGVGFGQPKKFKGGKDEIEVIAAPGGPRRRGRGGRDPPQAPLDLLHGRRPLREPAHAPGAKFPAGHFDTLVTETTRGTTERHPEKTRGAEMARLVASINDTIQKGGSFLIPVFALGRMQEILSIIHDARKFRRLVDCPIYGSGLGMDLVDYFDEISRKTKHLQFNRASSRS
jgi:hypothetical protein